MSRTRPTTPLQKIRPKAIRRVLDEFARGVDVRTSFEGQLIRFFDLLEQALASGDPAWLDSILYDWVNAATQTDRVEGHKNASLLINTLFIATSQIARDTLTKGEALDWLTTTQPYFAYALEKAARLELETRVTYFANEMTSVQQKLERLERMRENGDFALLTKKEAMLFKAAFKNRQPACYKVPNHLVLHNDAGAHLVVLNPYAESHSTEGFRLQHDPCFTPPFVHQECELPYDIVKIPIGIFKQLIICF